MLYTTSGLIFLHRTTSKILLSLGFKSAQSILVAVTVELHTDWSAKFSSILDLSATINTASHKPLLSILQVLELVLQHRGGLLPTMRNGHFRCHGEDLHLHHADSPLVSHKAQCWVLFCSPSIPAPLVRSYPHKVFHTTAMLRTLTFLHRSQCYHGWKLISWNFIPARLRRMHSHITTWSSPCTTAYSLAMG